MFLAFCHLSMTMTERNEMENICFGDLWRKGSGLYSMYGHHINILKNESSLDTTTFSRHYGKHKHLK